MRILMTASWFPSRKHATLGNFVQRHVEAIALQHQVVVLACFRLDHFKGFEVIKSVENDVTIYRVYSGYRSWQVGRARAAFRRGIEAIEQDYGHNFDIIHHHVIFPLGLLAAGLARKWRIPLVMTEHWTIYNLQLRKDQPRWLKFISKRAVAQAAMICPVSEDLAQTMQAYGLKGCYRVVPNVVDTSLFRIGEPAVGFHFLHISSLEDKHKNISGILRTWLLVWDKMPGAVLHIGGDGPYQHWAAEAEKIGIPSNTVSFFGECSPQEVAQRMSQCHCLLMFSNYENLPVVIVEALASGLPVISSKVGGIAEHIHRDRGMLVKPGDEEELRSALLAMYTIWPDYHRFDIRRYAVEQFSREAIAQKYDAVYREVADRDEAGR